ncbi:MAG: DNA primase [Armatimonadota bacterium]
MHNWREAVLEHIDLVELISEYVVLERAGKNFKALCPFHSEKTPSFFVSPTLNRFHCFGCGASGDAVGFLMRIEGLSFREALRQLAERAGIQIEETQEPSHPETQDTRERLYRVVYAAHFYYRQCLRRTPNALHYLQARGLTESAIERFELGFAPDGWEHLVRFLQKHQLSLEDAQTAGLIESGREGYYDRFRNRIIFPIHDARGRVVAFGARTMGHDEPKYLNSRETPLFEKRNQLYGWHLAREEIVKRRSALIVEGYLDLIMLHQYGFPHAVATLGTAFTEAHARRLKRLVERVYLMYDSDSAGVRATLRAGEVLMEAQIPVFVVRLPEGEDPDSLLRQYGAETMQACLQQATTLALFGLEQIIQSHLQQAQATQPSELDIPARTQLLQEALPWVARIPNAVEQMSCLERLVPFSPTATLSVPVILETLQSEVRQIQRRQSRRATPVSRPQESTRSQPQGRAPQGLLEAERTVLRAWLNPSYHALVKDQLPHLCWADPHHAQLAEWLRNPSLNVPPTDGRALLAATESEALAQLLTALLLQEKPALTQEVVAGCLLRMQQYAKKLRLEALKQAGQYNEEYWSLLKELKATSPTPKSRNSEPTSESNS